MAEFSTSIEDKKTIYVLYIRSILEQSCVVWHSSLTQENSEDLERVQKAAIRIILGQKYENYEDALIKVNLDSLKERREKLCKKFALKCVDSDNVRCNDIFEKRKKIHNMATRKDEPYVVNYANTERLKTSAVPYLQRILNSDENMKKEGVKRKIILPENIVRKRRKPGKLTISKESSALCLYQ